MGVGEMALPAGSDNLRELASREFLNRHIRGE